MDPTLIPGLAYYYAVTARVGSAESAPAIFGPIVNIVCAPALSGGIRVSRVNSTAVPLNTVPRIKNGDAVTWEVTIRNQPPLGTAEAFDVYVDYRQTENVRYSGNPDLDDNGSGDERFNGAQALTSQHVIFDANSDMGDKDFDTTNWLLTFDAVVDAECVQPVDFMNSIATIFASYPDGTSPANFSASLASPIYVIQCGSLRIPKIIEIAP